MRTIEGAKVATLARLAGAWIKRHRYGQVAIFAQYTATVDRLQEMLEPLGALTMKGSTTQKRRAAALDKFESGECQVLICNIIVGGVGVSMHDLSGMRPRLALIVPSYRAIAMHQAAGRIWRVGTRSKATVRLVYGFNAKVEARILQAIAKKAKTMRGLLHSNGAADVVLPGEYDALVEPPAGERMALEESCREVAAHIDRKTWSSVGTSVVLPQVLDMVAPCV